MHRIGDLREKKKYWELKAEVEVRRRKMHKSIWKSLQNNDNKMVTEMVNILTISYNYSKSYSKKRVKPIFSKTIETHC